jgi:hypothetical protein
MFGHMLMVYPAVMMLFAASQITAAIMASNMISIMSVPMILAVMAAPVFFVKKVITSTSSVMGAASAAVGKVVQTTVAVGAAVATGGATAAIAGKSVLGGAAKSALGQTSAGKAGLGMMDQIDQAKTKAGRKNFQQWAASSGQTPLDKHGEKYKEEMDMRRAERGYEEGKTGSSRSNTSSNTNSNTATGAGGSNPAGGDGAGSNNNSLEDLRALFSKLQKIQVEATLKGDGAAAAQGRAALATQALSTGLISNEAAESINNGTFNGNTDEAIAQHIADSGVTQEQYNQMPAEQQQIINQVLGDNSTASEATKNAALEVLTVPEGEQKVNVNINVDSSTTSNQESKTTGNAKINHGTETHGDETHNDGSGI